jgi:hypothetical protein
VLLQPPTTTTTTTTTTLKTEFHVITQYYLASTLIRQNEINECLIQNLNLKHVTQVHVLTEKEFTFNSSLFGHNIHKLVQHVVYKRLTFDYAFNYCNKYISKGHICCVTNADIYFNDQSINNMIPKIKNETVYATLRYENDGQLLPRIDSQDSWIFKSPIYINNIHFEIGRLRSDNRIASQIIDSKYRIINNPFVIHTHHLQSNDNRPGRTNIEQIPGKTTNILLNMEM